MPTGLGLRPGAKAPDEPPNPTGYAPPLDSTLAPAIYMTGRDRLAASECRQGALRPRRPDGGGVVRQEVEAATRWPPLVEQDVFNLRRKALFWRGRRSGHRRQRLIWTERARSRRQGRSAAQRRPSVARRLDAGEHTRTLLA